VYDPLIGYDPLVLTIHPAPPSARHLLGTDPLGRDVLSQLMYSTASEFILGMVAALITMTIATTVGALSAYFGGVVDTIFMRLADLIITIPFIVVLIVLSALTELTLFQLALLIGMFAGFGATTIVIKSQALTIKVRAYIEAARVAGGASFGDAVRGVEPWTALVLAPAAAAVLAGFFCTDAIPFALATDSAPGGVARSYPGFSAAAAEAGRSRVFGGQHFEFSNQAGLAAGRAIADEVLTTALLRNDGSTTCAA